MQLCTECGLENPGEARYCMRCGSPIGGRPVTGRTPEQRVVVTGMGAVTPLGLTVDAFWDGLVDGRSGIRRITRYDVGQYPSQIGGLIDDFEPSDYMDRKEARRMARFSQYALAAAQMAVDDAGLEPSGRRPEAGVLLGCAVGGVPETEDSVRTLIDKGGMRVSPFLTVTMPPNMAAFHIAKTFDFVGYSSTCSTACAAGTQAIGEAADIIRRGYANVMVTGGTEAPLAELVLAAFNVGRALSTRNDEPGKASRPFDADRDGFVGGEGAAILILESLAHAQQRGAHIHAEVLGYATSNDAYHLIAPDPEARSATAVMQAALHNACVEPTTVDYVNAHGTGTPLGDVAETLAIKQALGEHAYKVAISSTKSMIGHMWGAAGAAEAIATIKTLQTGVVHPTINLETPDPECDLDYVPLTPREMPVKVAMSNSFGLGGQNASIVLGRHDREKVRQA